MFVGSDTGFVYALDAATGCVHWSFRARAGVRTAPTIGAGDGAHRFLAYFGDIKGSVYAVDAETGAEVWTARVDTHPVARVTGAPKLAAGRLFVPMSSLEESGAGNPSYPCCTFRGGVAAYDAKTGARLWKNFTVADEPRRTKRTSVGTQLWAPAGAGVWSSPTIDLERRAVYLATGNGYTQPADIASDAVIAFDLDTGKRLWVKQVMANDSYVRDCPGIYRPNVPKDNKSETCPDDLGPDMDFGNSPILRARPGGKTMIVIGQKDGHAWGLDPDKTGRGDVEPAARPRLGERRRRDDVGLGRRRAAGLLPGDRQRPAPRPGGGSTSAPARSPGAARRRPGRRRRSRSCPASSSRDRATGMVYAYGTADGKALWQFDTDRDFQTVNGVKADGGGINAAGPVVAGGMLFVTSGYSDLGGGNPGNVLLAFAVRPDQGLAACT